MLGGLHQGMLVRADCGFYGYGLWGAATVTRAHLLWRARNNMHLPVVRDLPDGSHVTHINAPRAGPAQLAKNGKRRRLAQIEE